MSENATDFRRVYPFVFGLIKILLRKMTFLISESNSTLESLKNPFASDDLEEDVAPIGETKKRPVAANKRDGAYQAPQQNKIKRNFIDLSHVQYHGLDQRVFEKIEEAMKLDFIAMQQKRQKDENVNSSSMLKKEERDSVMMEDGDEIRHQVKQEFLGDEGDIPLPNIREMVDTSGDFLKNINSTFGLTSPIQHSRDEIRAAAFEKSNAYMHNMNLSLELQNIVNEHLMMEEYPAADDYLAGLDREAAPMDMPLDFMGGAQNDLTMIGGDEGLFFP